ncbi:MAG: beta-N-acetylhexosaminidase [Gemmatimonadota bacterium]|nr:beta-N-acetylhexosaminidase [Gemmatimonadota bacterium]
MAGSGKGERGSGIRPGTILVVAMIVVAATAALAATWQVAASARSTGARRAQNVIAVIPQPTRLTPGSGEFVITSRTTVWADDASAAIGRQLAASLAPATGFMLEVRSGADAPPGSIQLRQDTSLAPGLGREGYRLDVRPDGVVAQAAEPAGLFYAIQTIRQLLPPEIFRSSQVAGLTWSMPAVTIEDVPRFGWRGAHLDVARHFMPKEFVKKYIDLLALHKMNSFHWHLTEDQGWRIEIRKYPRLTEVGAWRKETVVGRPNRDTTKNKYDGTRHGGFYTQADVREVVAYAAERFVNVVPEIEMPGHAQAAIAAYPWLGNYPDRQLEVWNRWGVNENILNAEPRTIAFMQDVLAEVLELFPSKFIHVGGDEAVKTQWRSSPRAQARIRELGLRNEAELQSWFIRQMDAYLAARGRRLVGWDEILEGGIAPGATVMSWRGVRGGIAAARAGHDVVMAPTTYTYFDYYQSPNRDSEPLAIGGLLPLDSVYGFEPIPADLEPQYAKHVLGAQGQLWTEYMPTSRQVEYMAFPRMTALAEVVWSPKERKHFADFSRRLDVHLRRLDELQVNYRKPN